MDDRTPLLSMTRREFLKYSTVAGTTLALGLPGSLAMSSQSASRVSFVHTRDRASGTKQAVKTLGVNPVKNKDVLLKPNFNTADPVPGSTDNQTLVSLVEQLWSMGARTITLGERSYPLTATVMEEKGIHPLMRKLDVRILNFDDLQEKDWVLTDAPDSHWRKGFRVARPVLEADSLVSTCCLKTHQYGGVFTMSLKLHVGVVPTDRHGYGYMNELHSSPFQRKMIAEINAPYTPDLILMDGIDVFVDGGPMTGKRAEGNAVLASTDRVALDAVGLAVLKDLGSNEQIMKTPIFAQEQISRSAELGLGASSPSRIKIVPDSEASRAYAGRIEKILRQG